MIIYTVSKKEWDIIKNEKQFYSKDYKKQGFIHCSKPNQTIWVLNKHFRNTKSVILVCIDEKKLNSKIIDEDLNNKGEKFPHIYGSINNDSIEKIIQIEPDSNGLFHENKELKNLHKKN